MRYKDIFKKWWFWLFVGLDFLLQLIYDIDIILDPILGIAILIYVFIEIWASASIIWLISEGIKKFQKKR